MLAELIDGPHDRLASRMLRKARAREHEHLASIDAGEIRDHGLEIGEERFAVAPHRFRERIYGALALRPSLAPGHDDVVDFRHEIAAVLASLFIFLLKRHSRAAAR